MMTNERCRLISESQWREYQECVQKIHILNEANMTLENAIASHADHFRQQISVLEDRMKEAEGVVKAIHYGIEKGFTTCDCCGYENSCSDCYYNDVAKQYLEKYGVQK